jgi:maltokinase
MTAGQIAVLVAEWLPAQRWFGGKGRPIAGVDVHSAGRLTEEPRPLDIWLADVTYADGHKERYQTPLTCSDERLPALEHALVGAADELWWYDAPQDKQVSSGWLEGIAGRWSRGALRADRDTDEELDPSLPSIVVGAEQSNTSLVYGDQYILKLFRRLAPGVNPDLEISRALRPTGCPNVLPPLGWVSLADDDSTLAMLQPFLRSATEGWAMAGTSVRDLYAEEDLHAYEVGGDFAAEADRLGAATAAVHAALATALPTGMATPEQVRDVAKAMNERLDAAMEIVPELSAFADGVRASFEQFGASNRPVPIQRIHGDLHLGQVLRTQTGWVLLDFEGEPARPLAERRRPMSRLRDVAGMLRSFDYAARHLLADRPGATHLAYRANEWAERNRDAFCTGYAEEAGADPREEGVLLRAFELDKAVYEVAYEARNRPTWLPIPLGSIERLVA